MIPSPKWFPSGIQDRAAWYDNFDKKMQDEGASLGFSPAELTSIAADNDVMQFLASATVTLDTYADAVRTYRRVITEGDIGDVTPDFPDDIVLTLPGAIATGLFERLDKYVKRIRVAPAYTEEIGALVDIIPSTSGGDGPAEPVIDASVEPGNEVIVTFVKGKTSGVYVETNVDGGGWTLAGTPNKSPFEFTVPASDNNTPRSVQIRARFLDGNNPIGEWSTIVTVQTIP